MKPSSSTNPTPDWNTPWQYGWRGQCINALVEARLHLVRLMQPADQRRLVIFPCGDTDRNPSSLLRAYRIGTALRRNFNWRVTIVPPRLSLDQRRRILDMEQPNLIYMQMERHPLNRPHLYRRFPVVFDIDDADFLWEHARDAVEACCRDSVGVTAGSNFVADYAKSYNENVEVIWTGGPDASGLRGRPQHSRGNIIAWGHSRPLDYPAEADFIQQVLLEVSRRMPIEYWIFGCGEQQGRSALANRLEGSAVRVRFFESLPYDVFTSKLSEVAIGLQVLAEKNEFSRGKSFGKVLNYVSAGVVVVASNAADHPLFFRNNENGCLATDFQEWVDTISGLLQAADRRQKLSVTAFADYKRLLTVDAAARRYHKFFSAILQIRDERIF
jgi:hypothetical protein